MLNKIRDDIVRENIKDIHNNHILKNIRNYMKNHNNKLDGKYYYNVDEDKININIEWKKKSLDMMSLLWIFLLVFSTLYIGIVSNTKIFILSNVLLLLGLYLSKLDGTLDNLKEYSRPNLDDRYKKELEIVLHKYLDVIEKKMKEGYDIEKLRVLSLSDYLDSKYIIISECDILNELINIINMKDNKLIKKECNEKNADVIVRRVKRQLPIIDIKNIDVIVEYNIDNGVFCVGEVTETSKIVKIEIDEKYNIKLKDSGGVLVYIM
jgi:hypothetical protein